MSMNIQKINPVDVVITEENYYRDNPSLPSSKTKIEFTVDMIKEIKKCSKDIVHFGEEYFYIVNLDRGKEIIKLYNCQKKILKSLSKDNRVVLVSSRQMGKTTLLTIFALWYTCFNADKTVLIVANKEKTAREVLSRIRLAYELLPIWLKPAVVEWQKESVIFGNNSKVVISSTSSSAARSTSVNCLIIDECAHIDDFKEVEFFNSVLPVISSSKKSKIFITSTPKGTANYFYKTYAAAERGDNNYKHFKVIWRDIPGRDMAWKKQALADVNGDEQAFRQEYECEFVSSGESAIDKELLSELRSMCKVPEILNTPEYKVWEVPDSKKIYSIGVDVADGVGGAASIIQGLDITDLTSIKQVFIYTNRYIDPTTFTKELYTIAKQWGKPWLAIERNSMGGEVVSNLMKAPYNYERLVSYSNDKSIDYEKKGINSSTNCKYDGVSNMRYWLNILKAVNIYDLNTVQELETFVKHPNGTWKKQAGENIFDDRVMGLCWALFQLYNPIAESIFEIVEHDDNGKPLKIKKDYYDADVENHFNLSRWKQEDWGDAEFVPAYIGVKQNQSTNQELDDMMSDGWQLWRI